MAAWWTTPRVEELTRHQAAGLSYSEIAAAMGRTRGGICSAVRRYVHKTKIDVTEAGRAYDRKAWVKRSLAAGRLPQSKFMSGHRWTEEFLTEPYAVRKARKSLESIGR